MCHPLFFSFSNFGEEFCLKATFYTEKTSFSNFLDDISQNSESLS